MKGHTLQAIALIAITLGAAAITSAQDTPSPIRAVPIEPGSVRPPEATKPGEPGEEVTNELLKFANMLYSYGNYEQSVIKYTEFLNANAGSPQAEKAWYQLADSYRRLKKMTEAKQCYDVVLKKWPKGDYAGASAYTMAVLMFNSDKFAEALPYFQVASTQIEKPELKTQSQFFLAYSHKQMGKEAEAIKAFESVLSAKANEEYRDRSELEMARLYLKQKNTAKALLHFGNLANKAKDKEIQDEARFNAGLMGLESADGAKAEKFLEENVRTSTNESYKAKAQMALIVKAYERKEYDRVLKIRAMAPLAPKALSAGDRAKVELLAAHATRHLKDYPQAIQLYGSVERNFPNTPEGTEAGYRKLQCFHSVGDKGLASFVDRYVADQSKIDPDTKFIDLALLLKAETLYENKQFAPAAEAYRNVRPENIDERYAPIRLYKLGWALTETEKAAEGVEVLGQFIVRHKGHELVPSALAKRALTYNKMENFDAALKDFVRLANDYPKSANAEFALQKIALIYTQKRQISPMIDAYRNLLERFPNTKIAGEAHYMIGGGLFDQKKYEECIKPLDQARKVDPKSYQGKASLRILLAHYHLANLEELRSETMALIPLQTPDLQIPIQVYAYLGRTYFDNGDFAKAEPFLTRTSDPSAPGKTPPDIWRKLATAQMKLSKYKDATQSLEFFYGKHQQHPEEEAQARLDKGICHLQLGELKEAEVEATEVLKVIRQGGRINSEARIMLGDIAMKRKDPVTAAQHYVIPCEFGNDPMTVPKALSKMIAALEAQGKSAAAQPYRDQLKARFPNYTAQN